MRITKADDLVEAPMLKMSKTFKHEKRMHTSTRNESFHIKGQRISSERPLVMGILNVTPDSFYAKSRVNDSEMLLQKAQQMIDEGADILDLGSQSTRPGAQRISADVEWQLLEPALKEVRATFPEMIISVDTFYGEIAEKAVDCGADIINDVSAGNLDESMLNAVAQARCPYVLMHMKGEPGTMQHAPEYSNIMEEMWTFFREKISQLNSLGIHDIILDPGFGFGKTQSHNMEILRNLDQLNGFGFPILAGLSRKKTIQNILSVGADDALNGTTVLNTIALMNGAAIVRVHDVREAKEAVLLVNAVRASALI